MSANDLSEVLYTLRHAGNQFRFYAEEHTAKGNEEKARVNHAWADACHNAMRLLEQPDHQTSRTVEGKPDRPVKG